MERVIDTNGELYKRTSSGVYERVQTGTGEEGGGT